MGKEKFCFSKSKLKTLLLLVIVFLILSFGIVKLSNLVNTKNTAIIKSKAAVSSKSLAQKAIPKALQSQYKINSTYLKDCLKKTGKQYVDCITQKTGLTRDKWSEIGKDKLIYNGKDIKKTSNILGVQSTRSSSGVNIDNIFVSDDFSKTYLQNIIQYIATVWEIKEINKHITLNNVKIISFDPTVKTNCYREGYWTKTNIYFPKEFCDAFLSAKYSIAITRITGWDGAAGMNGYGQGDIYVDSSGNFDDITFIMKHELGHALGINDNDFIDINGNNNFETGNNKDGSPYDDIFYKGRTREATIYSINSINNSSTSMPFFMNPYNFYPKGLSFDTVFESSAFTLYGGISGPSHIPGTILDDLICNGTIIKSRIEFSNCSDFKKGKYAVGFLTVKSKGETYKGNFDMIDLNQSVFNRDDYFFVNLKKVESSRPCKEYDNQTCSYDKKCKFHDFCSKCSDANTLVGLECTAYCHVYDGKMNECINSQKNNDGCAWESKAQKCVPNIDVTILTPTPTLVPLYSLNIKTESSEINTLNQIKIDVKLSVTTTNNYNWELCASKSSTIMDCKIISSGTNSIDENDSLSYINYESFERYEGPLSLKLTLFQDSQKYKIAEKKVEGLTFKDLIKINQITLAGPETKTELILKKATVIIDGIGLKYLPSNRNLNTQMLVYFKEENKNYTQMSFKAFTENQIKIAVPETYSRKKHTIYVYRDGLKSDEVIYYPKLGNMNISIIANPIEKYVIDKNENITLHYDFQCSGESSQKIVFGLNTITRKLNNNVYSIKECKKNQSVVSNIRILSNSIISQGIIDKENAIWYVCSVFEDVGNNLFEKQNSDVITMLNLKKNNNLFYDCLTGNTLFTQRTY